MRHLTYSLFVAFLFIAALPAWAQASADVELNIAEQPLSTSLREVADSFDLTIAFYSESTDGLLAPALDGDYTSELALDMLLVNTNLEYTFINDSSVAVRPIETGDQGGDSDSKNSSQVPVLMVQNASSQAQTTGNRSDESAAEAREQESFVPLEEIIVTGTNILGVDNPTVPVLTFDREDIALSGATTVDDFLRTIPQNFASQTQLSAESGAAAQGVTGPNVTQGTTVDLRGLGAGSTLTLLNGRRMTPAGTSNFVDVNVLPLGIIERVDVLIDGATAIYGSDAVGGVINFVTRKDYEGFDVNARYGTVTEGSMEDWGVGGAGGFNWGSGGVFAGVDYHEQTPLLAAERDFVDLLLPQLGTRFGSDSERFSIAGGINQTFGSSIRFGVDVLYSDISSESNSISTADPRINTADQEASFVNARMEYDIGDNITASLFLDYGKNVVDTNQFTPATQFESSGTLENGLSLYEAQFSGKLLELPSGEVTFALGGLYREEDYENAVVAGTPDGISTSRDVTAGYAEVQIPLVGDGNALPFIRRMDLSLAGRYEDYSDMGDSLDPKVGIYWEVNDELSLRASYSEAFRAPDLQTLSGTSDFLIVPIALSSITAFPPPEPSTFPLPFPFPDFAVVAFSDGLFNPNLVPEEADSWSAGLSYEPRFIDGLSIGLNYFTISYENRIESVGVFNVLQDASFSDLLNAMPTLADVQMLAARADAGEIELRSFFGESPEDVQIIIQSGQQNIAERDVSGFDLTLDYTIETEVGQFSAGANASYLVDYIGRLTDTSPSAEQLNVLYRPVDFKMRANLSWSHHGITAFTAVNYVDGYRDDIDPSVANGIDAWTTIDLSLTYDTGDRFNSALVNGLRFSFSVINLFDTDPPFVATPFGLNYDSANANPFNRRINLALSKRF